MAQKDREFKEFKEYKEFSDAPLTSLNSLNSLNSLKKPSDYRSAKSFPFSAFRFPFSVFQKNCGARRPRKFICANAPKAPFTERGFRGWVTHDLQKNCGTLSSPANFLVNQIVFLAAEARERCACAYDVATLGYNLKNIYLWSRIAQNCLFHSHKSFSVIKILFRHSEGAERLWESPTSRTTEEIATSLWLSQ